MSIGHYLNGQNFDPETTHAMGVALEIGCVALQLRNHSDPATTAMLAEKIIALAKAGERSATTLCDRALSELGVPPSSARPLIF
jgi:hypothetical protein